MIAKVKATGEIIDVEYNDGWIRRTEPQSWIRRDEIEILGYTEEEVKQRIDRTQKSYVSDAEREILDLLAETHNKFVALADKHPTAMQEWTFYIHGLESLIEHRICSRIAKDVFR